MRRNHEQECDGDARLQRQAIDAYDQAKEERIRRMYDNVLPVPWARVKPVQEEVKIGA
jgi:hypothetical protein